MGLPCVEGHPRATTGPCIRDPEVPQDPHPGHPRAHAALWLTAWCCRVSSLRVFLRSSACTRICSLFSCSTAASYSCRTQLLNPRPPRPPTGTSSSSLAAPAASAVSHMRCGGGHACSAPGPSACLSPSHCPPHHQPEGKSQVAPSAHGHLPSPSPSPGPALTLSLDCCSSCSVCSCICARLRASLACPVESTGVRTQGPG